MKITPKSRLVIFVLTWVCLLWSRSPVHAIPTLQLGESGSTMTAYLIPDRSTLLAGTFYLSLGVTPKLGLPGATLGSFDISYTDKTGLHEHTVAVTGGMTFGNPGLPRHGFFDTYYAEFAFEFNPANVVPLAFNVENPSETNPNVTMYYQVFTLANYPDPDMFHVDLYHRGANGGVDEFAPFSHDLDACCDLDIPPPPPPAVPEPTTLLLLGAGLLGFTPRLRRAFRGKSS